MKKIESIFLRILSTPKSSIFKMNTYRAYSADGYRVGTYVVLKDSRILQVYPNREKNIIFMDENDLRNGLVKLSERLGKSVSLVCNHGKNEVKEKPAAAPAPSPLATADKFTCPACGCGSGADHRMCICNAYNYSIKDWEIACRLRPAPATTVVSAPAPKVVDKLGHEAARTAFGLSDYSRLTNMGCSDVKRLSAITDPELMDAAELLTKLIRAGKINLMDKESGAAFTASGVVGFGSNKLLIFNER